RLAGGPDLDERNVPVPARRRGHRLAERPRRAALPLDNPHLRTYGAVRVAFLHRTAGRDGTALRRNDIRTARPGARHVGRAGPAAPTPDGRGRAGEKEDLTRAHRPDATSALRHVRTSVAAAVGRLVRRPARTTLTAGGGVGLSRRRWHRHHRGRPST